jgi:signal transduction histidine kinase
VELAFAVPEASVLFAGDETLLERAVGNLVHNAVRHGHAGGHVAVVLEARASGFELRVRDDGPGMSPAQAQRVLTRAAVGDGSRSRGGHGLGLFISARAARLHGLVLEFVHPEEGGLEVVLRS